MIRGEHPMAQLPQPITLPDDTELARSLKVAEEQGEPLRVAVGDTTYAVFVERSTPSTSGADAALAAGGSWKDLVDAETLKKQIKEARGSNRSPASL